MKNKEICPKCQWNEIFLYKGAKNHFLWFEISLLPKKSVRFDKYICMNCGYTEEWCDEILKNYK